MTDPITVYAVQGSWGDYSDYSEWIVLTFFDKQQAEDTAKYLNDLPYEDMRARKDAEWEATYADMQKRGFPKDEYTQSYKDHNAYWQTQCFPENGYTNHGSDYYVIDLEVI